MKKRSIVEGVVRLRDGNVAVEFVKLGDVVFIRSVYNINRQCTDSVTVCCVVVCCGKNFDCDYLASAKNKNHRLSVNNPHEVTFLYCTFLKTQS